MSSICAKRDSPYALNGLIDRWKVFFLFNCIFFQNALREEWLRTMLLELELDQHWKCESHEPDEIRPQVGCKIYLCTCNINVNPNHWIPKVQILRRVSLYKIGTGQFGTKSAETSVIFGFVQGLVGQKYVNQSVAKII